MTKERVSKVWNDIIIPAYNNNTRVGPHGTTGNPNATVQEALDKGASMQELINVMYVLAFTKPHDGRIDERNRRWLADENDIDLNILSDRVGGGTDLRLAWVHHIGNTDAIHTTHLDNLMYTIRRWGVK